jgi:DNA-binding NarL/FixJ family response regulator
LARTPFIFLTAKGEKHDLRSGMDFGADDYLTKPVANADLIRAIESRLRRSGQQQVTREFKPDFSSAAPLVKLGLTPRAAEALLWLAQGKTNSDIASILGIIESTVKKHVQEMFEKLGVESRLCKCVLRYDASVRQGETQATPRRLSWGNCGRRIFRRDARIAGVKSTTWKFHVAASGS